MTLVYFIRAIIFFYNKVKEKIIIERILEMHLKYTAIKIFQYMLFYAIKATTTNYIVIITYEKFEITFENILNLYKF